MITTEARLHEQAPAPPPTPSPIGRIITGVLVIVVGMAWFLDLATDIEVRWGAILPIALIALGIGVMYGANRQDVAGLVGIGVILSAVVVTSGFFATAPWDGVGEVTERPSSMAALHTEYSHGVGDFTVDLRSVAFGEGTTKVDVSLGIGLVRVLMPSDVTVVVDANSGVGKVTVFDEIREGVDATLQDTAQADDARRVELTVGVGLGEVEVTR